MCTPQSTGILRGCRVPYVHVPFASAKKPIHKNLTVSAPQKWLRLKIFFIAVVELHKLFDALYQRTGPIHRRTAHGAIYIGRNSRLLEFRHGRVWSHCSRTVSSVPLLRWFLLSPMANSLRLLHPFSGVARLLCALTIVKVCSPTSPPGSLVLVCPARWPRSKSAHQPPRRAPSPH